MEQHINQGQKLATLLLASSILIAGLAVGGAIITRNTSVGSGLQVESEGLDPHSHQAPVQPTNATRQAPGCGV